MECPTKGCEGRREDLLRHEKKLVHWTATRRFGVAGKRSQAKYLKGGNLVKARGDSSSEFTN